MSVEFWDIEKDLCRCCHAQGTFDNLALPHAVTHLDDAEIYTDMLKDCLNIEIPPVPGDLCIMTYKICKTCIKKLRNANNFRKQVKSCEERFLDMFYKNRVRALNSTLNVIVKKEEQENLPISIDLKEEDSPSPADDDDYHIKHDFDDEDDKESSDDDISLSKCKLEKSKRGRKCKEESKSKKERIKKEKTQRTDSIYDEFYTLKENTEDSSQIYSCNTCLKSYKKFDGFKQHYRHVHLKQRPKLIGCYYCAEKVPHHKRASHLEDVHGVPAPSCGACGKKFNFPFQVLRHHKTYHMGEKKFVCVVCDRLFASNAYLSAHMVKHSSERPFKCDICDDAFKWKKHLKRHVLLHLSRKQN